jgi:hypothetical protein
METESGYNFGLEQDIDMIPTTVPTVLLSPDRMLH